MFEGVSEFSIIRLFLIDYFFLALEPKCILFAGPAFFETLIKRPKSLVKALSFFRMMLNNTLKCFSFRPFFK